MRTAIELMVQQLMSIKPASTDRKARILAMSKTMSQYKIAFELGISRTQVYNVLRAHREGKQHDQSLNL